MTEFISTPVIRDPIKRKLVSDKDQALEEYIANNEQYGEEDFRTQSKLILYILRSHMLTIREQVQGIKGILIDFKGLSDEIDSIFEEIGENSTSRFKQGLEKYPRFMQNSIARRRAKRYRQQKISDLKFMLRDIQDQLEIMPVFMNAFSSAIIDVSKGMSKSLIVNSKGKKKKKGGIILSDDMVREIEAYKKSRGGAGGAAGGSDAGSDVGGTDSTVGQGGGNKPAGGGSDKWDD